MHITLLLFKPINFHNSLSFLSGQLRVLIPFFLFAASVFFEKTLAMESDKSQQKKSSAPANSVPAGKGFLWTQLTLRILAIAFALCSITITVTSDQSVHAFGLVLQTRYTYASSFK